MVGRDRAAAGDPGVEVSRLGAQAGVGGRRRGPRRRGRRRRSTLRRSRCRRRRRRRRLTCARRRLSRATTRAAMPPFMSFTPRPYSRPSRSVATNGSLDHCSRGSTSTASMWPFSSRLRPPPAPGQTGGELRAADEVEVVGHEAVALAGRLGLPQVGRGAQRGEPRRQQPLQGGFVARRVARLIAPSCRGRRAGRRGRTARRAAPAPRR